MKKLLALTAALGLATVSLSAIAPAQAAQTTLTYGVILPIANYQASAGQIANAGPYYQAVYDTLEMAMPNGSYKPWLADKLTYNKTRTKLTLHIRTGVKFTDGAPLTGDAVRANILAFQNGTSPRIGDAASISAVSAKGQNVIVTLKYPDPSLDFLLSGALYIQSPRTIGQPSANQVPVGSGPYVLNTSKTVAGSVYYYDPNPTYWNPHARKFNNLVIKVIADQTAAVNALKTGAVDLMNVNDKNSVSSLQASGIAIAKQRLDWVGLTLVDRAGRMGTPLKNVKVRQAINMAFNRPALLEAIANGFGAATEQIFANYNLGYDESLNARYPYDPAKAKVLLAEAGYPNGFTLDMPTTASFGTIPPAAIKQALGDIGITVNYTDVPLASFFAALQTPKFPAYYMSLGRQDNYVVVKTLIARDGAWNPSGYGDAKTDTLIRQIQQTIDKKKLASLYHALNAYIVVQAWFAPLFQADLTFGYNPKAVKVSLQPGNAVPFLLYGVSPA